MKLYITNFLKRFAVILEFAISIMLGIGILLLCLRMAASLINIPDLNVWPNYEDLLETCFNLIIGVELIRMMYHHTPDTVFEVLLFAIARHIIIDHSSIWSSLIGVCAIAVLFATRKYLFCEFDVSDEILFRASTKVNAVNKLVGVNIPHNSGETLLDVIMSKFEEFDTEIGVGASVYIGNVGLRVAKMRDGKITRIEVIHAIH
ncbi:MAG: transporter [Lachnospiraceae bacterium]